MENLPSGRNPGASLTEDLMVEILRHLPVRSVYCFKCVCRSWLDLIADHEHRKKLPQTLSGFFHVSFRDDRCPSKVHHFANVSGRGMPLIYPSLSFLPQCDDVSLLDCCNGLLLCRCFQSGPHNDDECRPFHYVVCNPATKEWVMLPDANWAIDENHIACLCFDPAVSSHFHVLEYVEDGDECVTGVGIYSSKTGLWNLHESGWSDDDALSRWLRSVFLNGFLHSVILYNDILVVDMEGKKRRTIPMPEPASDVGIIHQTQGRLCAVNVDEHDVFKLSIWILEDYDTDNWILKHTVSLLKLFEGQKDRFHFDYQVIAVHPECNLMIFVYGLDNTLMAYEMDRKEVHVIRNLGHDSWEQYLPYVPMFSESLANGR